MKELIEKAIGLPDIKNIDNKSLLDWILALRKTADDLEEILDFRRSGMDPCPLGPKGHRCIREWYGSLT